MIQEIKACTLDLSCKSVSKPIFYKYLQKQPPEMFYKKLFLKILEIFTGKHLVWSVFLKPNPLLNANPNVFLTLNPKP